MYINPVTLSNQSNPAPALLPLTAEQEATYLQYNGFVRITSTDPVTIEPDTEAWEAWKATLPPDPEPEPTPTLDERVSTLETTKADQTDVDELNEALNMILTGYTGEEAADETGA